ncbi:unnamed protein product [Linum trigynum]|uniref:Uncharacterized protein n=1 Tax=Linum trigynum TaxID=586398 RepID=A0AAV2FIV7_9ROSI
MRLIFKYNFRTSAEELNTTYTFKNSKEIITGHEQHRRISILKSARRCRNREELIRGRAILTFQNKLQLREELRTRWCRR